MINHEKILSIIIIIIVIICLYIGKTYESFSKKDWLENIFDRKEIITIPSRINNVKEFCKSFNLNQSIFNAILIKDIRKRKLEYVTNKCLLRDGEIACALSQEEVLRNFILSNDNSLLMLEDDLTPFSNKIYKNSNLLLKDLEKYIKNAYNNLPYSWDILYLGKCWDDCDSNININKYIVKTHHTLCHHAIAFSRSGANKILMNITHPLKKPIDHIVADLTSNGVLNSYALRIPVFYQNRDDLSTTIGNYDGLPMCKKKTRK